MSAYSKVIILSGSVAPLVAGLGIGQVLHGHSWGYLLIAAGLLASVPYFVRMARNRRVETKAIKYALRKREGKS
jgi:hypothetical protein